MAGKHGGAREGAGRPPKPGQFIETKGTEDSLEMLRLVMRDDSIDVRVRTRAAVALAQYEHTRRSDGGKKDEKERDARAVGEGKFRGATAPKLAIVKS